MDLREAWMLLGFNPIEIDQKFTSARLEDRGKVALVYLNLARKAVRAKSVEHHPDRGGSHEKFISIQKAFECILQHTESFIEKLEERLYEKRREDTKKIRIELK